MRRTLVVAVLVALFVGGVLGPVAGQGAGVAVERDAFALDQVVVAIRG